MAVAHTFPNTEIREHQAHEHSLVRRCSMAYWGIPAVMSLSGCSIRLHELALWWRRSQFLGSEGRTHALRPHS